MNSYHYEISVYRKATIEEGGNSRRLGIGDLVFSFDGDPLMNDEGGELTEMGYRTLITTLASGITGLSKSATQKGFSEGELIGLAVKQLEHGIKSNETALPDSLPLKSRG